MSASMGKPVSSEMASRKSGWSRRQPRVKGTVFPPALFLGSKSGGSMASNRSLVGEALSPEDVDVLRKLTPEQLLELVQCPKDAEQGDQAPLSLVDPERNPMTDAVLQPAAVLLHVYNLSESVRGANSLFAFSMDAMAFGGAFHVAVEVYGTEFAYGVCGVDALLPRAEEDHVYQCSVYLGETQLSPEGVAAVLSDMSTRWNGADYDLLGCNCCCFCSELVEELGVGPMPLWVDRLSRLLFSGREAGREVILASKQGFEEGSELARRGLGMLLDMISFEAPLELGLEMLAPHASKCLKSLNE